MPKCTINGKEVEVREGGTIMEAFYKLGEPIAHYCYHPGLSVAGVCRLCIVEIEGNPRPQIACNTVVTEGMKITNQSERIKEGVKWVLDFHLINHPLDCPICDQAGECGLQEQYMQFGKYDSEMAESKVKKHKVVDLGPTVVLDSERCILCARCTRFTSEVTKTHELGLFNRGDRTEIGCVDGKKLDNNYSLNTVDICPVGALTSKDFRFRQRVWYLKNAETICTGCSTGCSVKVYFNKEGFFRVKPSYNEQVNGYWMCDKGRDIYKFLNREFRLTVARKVTPTGYQELSPGAALKDASAVVRAAGASAALVLTGQYSVEEYEAIVSTFVNEFKSKNIYHWWQSESQAGEFDGLLFRGDRNPNTAGLKRV
ncbi:MAG: 2Fe-2S iron-sulfur cluster-binding protein, partial [Bdellovibrionaceae bacterium]|nr:2Fe-2S iron-sulfur cluster-binding protein [Pseudobdellovibrionaceae bacterium]